MNIEIVPDQNTKIHLNTNDVASAFYHYLHLKGIKIDGARTVITKSGNGFHISVDPSADIIIKSLDPIGK